MVWAQQDAGSPPTLQVYSRLTVVDATVTDSAGQPIQGLKQSDFSVFEDGKPQLIHNFEEVTAAAVPPLPQLPPNVYTNLQPEAPSAAVNILLLDLANEAPVDDTQTAQLMASTAIQRRVKLAAVQAIDQLPAGTRMMVVSLTNNLRIVQSFTSDKEMLKAAINAIPYDLQGMGNKAGVQADMRNRMVLESFMQIAADVLPIKARKNLIWFTMGIPQITDPNERPADLPDYTSELTHAYDQLNAAQVAIYPIDARGVTNLAAQAPTVLSMEAVAQATGGVAYYNTNNLATAVTQAVYNGANYYSLAYIPPAVKYDGKYHTIEVKVDRSGVNLVYRKGYFADDPTKMSAKTGLTMTTTPPPAYAGNMKAPMSRGLPTSQDILFDVDVEPSTVPAKPSDPKILGTLDPRLQNRRLVRYGFSYVVPMQQIDFSGSGKAHKASVDFDIAVYDANDHLLTGLSQDVKTNLTDATYQQQINAKEPMRFTQQIDLPTGQLFIRVGVLDHSTNKVGTLEIPLRVTAPRPTALAPAQ